jgi:hypothetical protein
MAISTETEFLKHLTENGSSKTVPADLRLVLTLNKWESLLRQLATKVEDEKGMLIISVDSDYGSVSYTFQKGNPPLYEAVSPSGREKQDVEEWHKAFSHIKKAIFESVGNC